MQQDLFAFVYSVTEITSFVKELLEEEDSLQDIFIKGEVSQFTRAQSGHLYFSLKDPASQLSCVMFKTGRTAFKMPDLDRGEMVVVRGSFSVYQAQGRYQFLVSEIRKTGVGDLYQQYLRLKEKLEKEGLFEAARKRPLPFLPHKIGIATSAQGAVIHDMIRVFRTKFPHIEVVLLPTLVQGIAASRDMCRSVEVLNQISGLELIILTRGGGSFEELFCFNDETLARTIAASRLPVISAVGHESDFTIADFVADYRASTPTAAAEIAVPDAKELMNYLSNAELLLRRQSERLVKEYSQKLDEEQRKLSFLAEKVLGQKRSELRYFKAILKCDGMKAQLKKKQETITTLMRNKLVSEKHHLAVLAQRIELLDVKQNLERGYSLTLKDGKIIKSIGNVAVADELETVTARGRIFSEVTRIKRLRK
ncbi:MAG: exodeoxyribonuclease VII large subunit [Bacteroidia bacterium]